MLTIWRGLFALAGLIAAMGLVGCTRLSNATPSVGGTPIGEPLAAFVQVRAEPPVAERAVVIRLHPSNPDSGPFQFQFEAGERIAVAEAGLPGRYQAAVNDVECSGTINLVAEKETDLVISLDPAGGCSIIATGIHIPGDAHSGAAVGGIVMGLYPPDSVVRVVSSDDPPNPVPTPRKPDEAGRFYFTSLVPGRYVIELASDGSVLSNASVELAPGEEPFLTLAVPSH